MEYTLAHGTANDFVLLADLDDRIGLPPGLVRALADRRRGLGADGVIRIGSGGRDAAVFMDHRNADGSVVEMCGTGVRVVAKHVIDHGYAAPDADGVLAIATRAGVKPVRVARWHPDGRVAEVTVDMGAAQLDPAQVPFESDEPGPGPYQVVVDGGLVELSVVSMGTPHAVIVVDDVAHASVTTLGPMLEGHPRFPARTNVGFVEVRGRAAVRLRVWERGVGETAACADGACAAVTVLAQQGLVGDQVAVSLPGGTLRIEQLASGHVMMSGPAVEVASGRLDDAWLAAVLAAGPQEDPP